jgi:hypothetical protein
MTPTFVQLLLVTCVLIFIYGWVSFGAHVWMRRVTDFILYVCILGIALYVLAYIFPQLYFDVLYLWFPHLSGVTWLK